MNSVTNSNVNNSKRNADENISSTYLSLIETIRKESEEVKDCYTRFSFQTIVASSAILGVLANLTATDPTTGFAALLVLGLILSVVRIGLHKYTSANRLYGFELYINRRRRLSESEYGWQKRMENIGWEEAYYAWRVVQPSIYNTFYVTSFSDSWISQWFHKVKLRHKFRNNVLVKRDYSKIHLYPGSYLEKTFLILHIFAIASLFPVIAAVYDRFLIANFDSFQNLEWNVALFVGALLLCGGLFLVIGRIRRVNSKRIIVESGVLSINSCAVIWHVVVIAHYRALDETRGGKEGKMDSYAGFTEALARQAQSICDSLEADPEKGIYNWINNPRKS